MIGPLDRTDIVDFTPLTASANSLESLILPKSAPPASYAAIIAADPKLKPDPSFKNPIRLSR